MTPVYGIIIQIDTNTSWDIATSVASKEPQFIVIQIHLTYFKPMDHSRRKMSNLCVESFVCMHSVLSHIVVLSFPYGQNLETLHVVQADIYLAFLVCFCCKALCKPRPQASNVRNLQHYLFIIDDTHLLLMTCSVVPIVAEHAVALTTECTCHNTCSWSRETK